MKKSTKQGLIAGGVAAAAVGLVSAIIFWPKKAAAGPGLPIALDANLSAAQKQEVADTLYQKQNDPAALSQAGYKYAQMGAPKAAQVLYDQAMSIMLPKLDQGIAMDDYEILLPFFVWTDPIMIQSAGLTLQSKNFPKAAAIAMKRAQDLAKLANLAA